MEQPGRFDCLQFSYSTADILKVSESCSVESGHVKKQTCDNVRLKGVIARNAVFLEVFFFFFFFFFFFAQRASKG